MTWIETTLGEVLPFKYGKNLPAAKRSHSGEFDVVTSAGVVDSHFEPFVTQPSVVIGRKGTIGSLTYCAEPCWPTDTTFFTTGSDACDLRFGYYFLQTVPLAEMNNDSAVPGLNRGEAEALPIRIHELSEQKRVGSLLGSLDTKIEANQLAIRAGHDLLLALYEAAPKRTTESFEQVCGVFGGSTPSTKRSEFWGGGIQWATPTDLTALKGPWLTGTERTITDAGLQSMSSSLHPEGSILMTSRATIGSVALAAEPVATNQGFIVVRASEELTPWIFCQLQERVREFEAWSNGATFLELSRGNFKKLSFHRAEPGALEAFNQKAWPILQMCKAKQAENVCLAKTRDELLPLLMSGKITVKEAEQEASAAGADIASEENKA
ncbi:restriction endonuclease subunit S [Corynebacterium sanguinis]|uniref:restriction endonuclease subunit S n=1 Tax=Corynebacterium sanguinis TaxID=2594913 RepID=UPI0021AFD300|nr:restriction endonuclease subunit S [Corynebacterium sanguinis]MCT1492112.1 restriction endonuclease subunit S [Corynebacterium sanguinis]MCT1596995.1 restriction endonuclease subunit S [Corynebacterium sanguinis]MCT2247290.1 restriction endonuclease subunit S [Corynebacterium sanguinis]MCT2252383.1 restriction endonuclease subunit S [Corynebacterium sanguinis]